MGILKELPELVAHNIITNETARKIQGYYASKDSTAHSNLFTIFGSIGALLVGLGIILIFAHNWDDFSRVVKVAVATIPLFALQALAGYTIFKNKSVLWKEVSGILLFCYTGASIALVGQIYNIPGSLSSFLSVWVLVSLPLVYLLRSSSLFCLLLVMSTFYALVCRFDTDLTPYLYLLFVASLALFYIQSLKTDPQGNRVRIYNFLIPVSIACALGTLLQGAETFYFVFYITLFAIFYSIGRLRYFDSNRRNGYSLLGTLGILSLLLTGSSKWIWEIVFDNEVPGIYNISIWVIMQIVSLYLAYRAQEGKYYIDRYQAAALVFPIAYFLAFYDTVFPTVLMNLTVLALGAAEIKKGVHSLNFRRLNFGLLIISVLVISRFFDTNMSFVLRGILFIAVGVGFFASNQLLIKRKKNTDNTTL